MNTNLKIKKLWQYLGIQDKTGVLIIRYYNKNINNNTYLLASGSYDNIQITEIDSLSELPANTNFTLVQYRDKNGRFTIPLVDRIKKDIKEDY